MVGRGDDGEVVLMVKVLLGRVSRTPSGRAGVR